MIAFPFPTIGRLLDRLPAVSFTADRHELWVGLRWHCHPYRVLQLHLLPGLGFEIDFSWSAPFQAALLKFMGTHMTADLDSLIMELPFANVDGERGFISFGPPA